MTGSQLKNNATIAGRIAAAVNRAGCWASGVAAGALFFAFGAVISLFTGDFLTTLQAVLMTALCTAGALWLAKRHR